MNGAPNETRTLSGKFDQHSEVKSYTKLNLLFILAEKFKC